MLWVSIIAGLEGKLLINSIRYSGPMATNSMHSKHQELIHRLIAKRPSSLRNIPLICRIATVTRQTYLEPMISTDEQPLRRHVRSTSTGVLNTTLRNSDILQSPARGIGNWIRARARPSVLCRMNGWTEWVIRHREGIDLHVMYKYMQHRFQWTGCKVNDWMVWVIWCRHCTFRLS